MIDLETLGHEPGCAIGAIGAVVFSENGLGDEFYRRVDMQSCVDCGLKLDVSTILWWMNQNEAARKEITRKADDDLPGALLAFLAWKNNLPGPFEIWGCGSDFDNPILEAAFDVCKLPEPWRYNEGRCYRTLASLVPILPRTKLPLGATHNALDDAKHQATHAVEILRFLRPHVTAT